MSAVLLSEGQSGTCLRQSEKQDELSHRDEINCNTRDVREVSTDIFDPRISFNEFPLAPELGGRHYQAPSPHPKSMTRFTHAVGLVKAATTRSGYFLPISLMNNRCCFSVGRVQWLGKEEMEKSPTKTIPFLLV